MNELIKINYDTAIYGDHAPTISGRDLHERLEIETPYTIWFERMCEYGFTEGKDYVTFLLDRSDGKAGKSKTDHQLTLSMAKEICMIQRSEMGKKFREYFISVEEAWNTPEMIKSRALVLMDREIKELKTLNAQLKVENTILQPKGEYFDQLVDRNLLTGFRETAKEFEIGERDFVEFLMVHKYIYRDKKGKLMSYAERNDGLFEVKECYNEKTQWTGTQTMITPKGREHFRLLCQGLRKGA